ncbi:MAG: histidine--tRNA ligase [Candidatus Gracilibacteria bacterium]
MSDKSRAPGGFPENLPSEQLVENRIRGIMERVYASYGYTPIETPAVENMETLENEDGVIKKEVYGIKRAAGEGDDSQEAERGLRFDLTVPFARYTAEHFNELRFPFKRSQIQKVWRGERPQKGRFREFYQADIDVIAIDNLPLHYDAEVVLAVQEVFEGMNIGNFTIHINHRKFLQGLLQIFGIKDEQTADALRIIDKADKVGITATQENLKTELGLSADAASEFLAMIDKKVPINEIEGFLKNIKGTNPLLEEGKAELQTIGALLQDSTTRNGKIIFNPKIARGLNYYTGSVYETTLDGLEKYGSICSGGRYANLASKFINKNLPGVGISIGLSRLLSIIKQEKLLSFEKQSVTDVMIGLFGEEQRAIGNKIAQSFRKADLNTEVYFDGNKKIGKQLEDASKRGIGYMVMIEGAEGENGYTIKNLQERKQETFTSVNEAILFVK